MDVPRSIVGRDAVQRRGEWLWAAAEAGDEGAVYRALRDAGAEARADVCRWVNESAERTTPLHAAVRNGNVKVVDMLLNASRNAEPHVALLRDANGYLPVHVAATMGRVAVLRRVLSARDANFGVLQALAKTDRDGCTALHWAASGHHALCVDALLRAGASARVRNHVHQTPRQMATMKAVSLHDAEATAKRDAIVSTLERWEALPIVCRVLVAEWAAPARTPPPVHATALVPARGPDDATDSSDSDGYQFPEPSPEAKAAAAHYAQAVAAAAQRRRAGDGRFAHLSNARYAVVRALPRRALHTVVTQLRHGDAEYDCCA